jgi:hypothetical protein
MEWNGFNTYSVVRLGAQVLLSGLKLSLEVAEGVIHLAETAH